MKKKKKAGPNLAEAGSEGQRNRPLESSLEYSAEILHLDEREKEWGCQKTGEEAAMAGLCLEQYRTSEIWK